MEFYGISDGKKEFMVDGLLSDIGIEVVLPIRSSPLATGVSVLPCTGTAPVALGVVDCPKRFAVIPTKSMYQVVSVCRDLAQNAD